MMKYLIIFLIFLSEFSSAGTAILTWKRNPQYLAVDNLTHFRIEWSYDNQVTWPRFIDYGPPLPAPLRIEDGNPVYRSTIFRAGFRDITICFRLKAMYQTQVIAESNVACKYFDAINTPVIINIE